MIDLMHNDDSEFEDIQAAIEASLTETRYIVIISNCSCACAYCNIVHGGNSECFYS